MDPPLGEFAPSFERRVTMLFCPSPIAHLPFELGQPKRQRHPVPLLTARERTLGSSLKRWAGRFEVPSPLLRQRYRRSRLVVAGRCVGLLDSRQALQYVIAQRLARNHEREQELRQSPLDQCCVAYPLSGHKRRLGVVAGGGPIGLRRMLHR